MSRTEYMMMITKIQKFQTICGTICRTLKGKIRQDTQLIFYKVMAIPAVLHGSEAWTLTARDTSRIHAAEMRFLRAVKGCARHDRLQNEDIRNELGVEPIQDKLSTYRENWKTHLKRMPEERIPTQRSTYCGSTLEEMEPNVRPQQTVT
jgi:hypothetical protein